MREVKLPSGVSVWSPYHNAEEAAVFCRMSRTYFMRVGGEHLPHTTRGKLNVWKEDVLVSWMEGYGPVPYVPEDEAAKRPSRKKQKVRFKGKNGAMPLQNPKNGKVYGGGG